MTALGSAPTDSPDAVATAPPPARAARKFAVAELYELWTLDVLLRLGSTAATIFEHNPQQFKAVPSEVFTILARLRYRLGRDETYLDADQRKALIGPLLGESDGTRHADHGAPFHQAAGAVRKAAVDYAQRNFDTGADQLRNAFRDAAKSLHAYLTILEGSVTDSALDRVKTHFNDVVTVLRSPELCAGLGLPAAPGGDWPRDGDVNGDGAAIIEELARRAAMLNGAVEGMDEAAFIAVQRIADYGAATLVAILADRAMASDDAANSVITTAYLWHTAIRDFKGDR